MNKQLTEIEIPKNATEPIFRLLLEDVAKALKTARAMSKKRLTILISQGE
ncbi:MAG: hypothetical protein NTV05_05215 [Acidobacteria bacterium]|nr:hypothetical protein [Acidobacteriota bacterium]